ncbi:MAG: hypothetical protein IPJ17_17780 [Holophagales bacterium]|nr:MAG: hypothetical protein IPJ17_17780 [Holophagales bacterium]
MNGIRAVAILRAALRSMALFLAFTLAPIGGFAPSRDDSGWLPVPVGAAFGIRAAAFGIALLVLLGPVLELAAVKRRVLAFRLALAVALSLAPMLAGALLADGARPPAIGELLGGWLHHPWTFGATFAPHALGAMLFAGLLGRRTGLPAEPRRPAIAPARSGDAR